MACGPATLAIAQPATANLPAHYCVDQAIDGPRKGPLCVPPVTRPGEPRGAFEVISNMSAELERQKKRRLRAIYDEMRSRHFVDDADLITPEGEAWLLELKKRGVAVPAVGSR